MEDNVQKKKVTKRRIETIETIETIENPTFRADTQKNEESSFVGDKSGSIRGGSVFGDVSLIDHPYLTRIRLCIFKFQLQVLVFMERVSN